MSNFEQLENLPILDLHTELERLLVEKKVHWNRHSSICLNALPEKPDDYEEGTGSLWYDWTKAVEIENPDGSIKTVVPDKENPHNETDFSVLCSVFKNTMFETVYYALKERYQNKLGRIRLMKMKSKTCLSWHQDSCVRVHYPIKTDQGCMMIIENEVIHMPQNTWWYSNTLPFHTAINASSSDRIHLVSSILVDD